MPQIYNMGPTALLPSEGRRAEDFFALKIRRLRPGLLLISLQIKTNGSVCITTSSLFRLVRNVAKSDY